MGRSHQFGQVCEQLAADRLCRLGWRVLDRNYRFGHKEIDLVIRRGDTVAFVEVKARSGSRFGHPLEAIGPAKRREIERVARSWIGRFGQPGDRYRFDAVAVTVDRAGEPRFDHVPDAWRAGQ